MFVSIAMANDTNNLLSFARHINTFSRNHPQEKVYLHMDNRSYYVGDTIWFKAYVMDATTLHPTQTSGVLYVELLNDIGAEMDRKKLEIRNGMCHGEFALGTNYRSGYYELRAYTRNMLNFGEADDIIAFYGEPSQSIGTLKEEEEISAVTYNNQSMAVEMSKPKVSSYIEEITYEEDDSLNYERRQGYRRYIRNKKGEWTYNWVNHCVFSRVFPIYKHPEAAGEYNQVFEEYPFHPGLAKPYKQNPEERPDILHISYYPEGGMLVDGVESVIAIETKDQWMRKQNVKGYVEDLDGNVITTFATTYRGRGTFSLQASREKQHIICIEYKGTLYKYSLPYIERKGYGISLTPPIDADADVPIAIKASPYNDAELIGWTLQCRGTLIANDTISVAPGTQKMIYIPSSLLNGGVNQFTLYNAHGEVLADRLFWVTPHVGMTKKASIHFPDSVEPYESVALDIQVGGKRKRHQSSFLSISVTDAADRIDSYDTRNIWSELLLSSELKGFIEDVDSYFLHDSKQKMVNDIDLLMLVQGWRWRRYEWHTMAGSEPYVPSYAPERGLGVDGYVIAEASAVKGPTYHTDSYPRIPNLEVNLSFGVEGDMPISYVVHSDSLGRFSMELEQPIYGRIPLTINLLDTEKASGNLSANRLWNSQVVLNRSFHPQPQLTGYYETAAKVLPVGMDTLPLTMPQTILHDSPLERGIFMERPELVVDYEQEWNWLIDRGIPSTNYRMNDWNIQYHQHHYWNYPYLSYSLRRMNNSFFAVIERDSFYAQVATQYQVPYRMPKKIKVYSNLLGRSFSNFLPTMCPSCYLVVEHCDSVNNPERPPYLPNNGVRHTYFEGYSPEHEFYNPDYSQIPLPENGDYRRTLYWNPELKTDHRGRASVSFYNNARTKHLHIRAEGFTRNGEFIVYDSKKDN